MSDIFSIEGSYNLKDNVTEKLRNVSAEVDIAGEAATRSEKKYDAFSNKMDKIGSGMQKVGGNMTKFLALPLAVAGVASFKLASDYEESINKIDVAFKENSQSVKDWGGTTLKNFGIAKGTALDMASIFGDMGSAMGISSDKNKEMSTSLVGLAGDLSSYKNVKLEVAQTALNGIYTGEGESLKQLGIIMTDATLKQYMLDKGMQGNYATMTQGEKVQLRYQYVTEMSKNAVGDFQKTSGGAANQTRMFGEGMKELGQTIGTQLLPMFTPMIIKVNEWIQGFAQMDDKTKKLILILGGIGLVIGPLIVGIGSLVGAIGTIAGMFTVTTVAVGGATVATTGFGVALGAAIFPVTLIVAAIAALVAAIVYLWKTNEGFRTAVISVWEGIKSAIMAICDVLKAFWEQWGGYLVSIVTSAMDLIGSVFSTAFNVIAGIFNMFTSALKGDWQGVFQALLGIVVSIFNGILSFLSTSINFILSLFGTNLNSVVSTVTGIFNAIMYAIKHPIEAAIDIVKWGIEKIKGYFNFNWSFPHLKMPHFSWSGSANPLKWGEEGVPSVGVEWYSKGGIFTQPTVLGNVGVGDAQNGTGNKAEAVMPIDNLRGMIKDLLQVQIALVVDGKEFVRQVVAPHNGEITEYNKQYCY